ncbi:MAG TPA: CoA transferase [Nocardioides sp.]|jgi:crotonobetainyl-CoA:carnitine CoA-transferase CaiB-like acyl-CoA transferase|uniref:CaiB/BaiF CoA transferase family protein n=1 Tax=Nocardioides sp. TaxID=35761 RepID=UPI002E375B4F|nr:CoA transferase [Nocardioides sp.]HEX3930524.1 CoA transferase [Nocardioides sp.]
MAALDGIRVLDLTHGVAGPYATMLLADLGCDVLKVEMPGRGDASRYMNVSTRFESQIPRVGGDYFMSINRNKRSVTLDLKSERGADLARHLAGKVDLVVQNFRPGVVERLGLGVEDLMAQNPALIYASLSAYGKVGPLAGQPGMDVAIQARSGVMSITGDASSSDPIKPGVSLADFSGGAHLVIATLAALVQRGVTGKGTHVEISLLDATMSMLSNYCVAVRDGHAEITPMGSGHPQLAPFEAVRTSDGYLVIAPGTNSLFRELCRVLERTELTEDERFSSNPKRVRNRRQLIDELEIEFTKRTMAEWLVTLERERIPCAPVNTLREAYDEPQLVADGLLREVVHPELGAISQLGAPYLMGGELLPIRMPPPMLGEHTAQVLTELLDLTGDQLQELAEADVISVLEDLPHHA